MVQRYLLSFALLLSAVYAGLAQSARTVRIFQYEGTDSSARKLALTRVYNRQHQLVSERCKQTYYEDVGGYQHRYADGVATRNTYQDTILVESLVEGMPQGDKLRTLYTHDQTGRRTGWRSWDYTRALKPGVHKGLTSGNGCIVTEKDLAARHTWQSGSAMRYRYDMQGRLAEYELLQDTAVSSRRLFQFDAQGRLRERTSFCNPADPKPCYRDVFFYDTLGVLQKEVRYSYGKLYGIANYHSEGSRRYEDGVYDNGSGTPTTSYHHVKTLSAAGCPTKEIYYQGNCVVEATITTTYRSDGRVARTVRSTCKDKRRVVHDYVYEDFN